MEISRRSFTKLVSGTAAGSLIGAPFIARGQAALKPILITVPQSTTSHLPIHAAIAKGFFAKEGLEVRVLDMETGTQHTNAVLSGQAFAFAGGPEHNAFADLKGANLKSVCNMVDRNNNYMTARAGLKVDVNDLAGAFRGKTIVTNFYGSTVNSTTRYLCLNAGLKLGQDVKLVEGTQGAALVSLKNGLADYAMVSEPVLTKGIKAGIWQEPFWQGPSAFGSYAYTTLSVAQSTIDKDPKSVASFVRAMKRGLDFIYVNQREAIEIELKRFPTMSADDIRVTLKRCFADNLWSRSGLISEDSWAKAEKVVLSSGLLKQAVPYKEIIDMQFVTA